MPKLFATIVTRTIKIVKTNDATDAVDIAVTVKFVARVISNYIISKFIIFNLN